MDIIKEVVEHHPDGYVWKVYTTVNGIKEGIEKTYGPGDRLSIVAQYKNGLATEADIWLPDGTYGAKALYIEGMLAKYNTFF